MLAGMSKEDKQKFDLQDASQYKYLTGVGAIFIVLYGNAFKIFFCFVLFFYRATARRAREGTTPMNLPKFDRPWKSYSLPSRKFPTFFEFWLLFCTWEMFPSKESSSVRKRIISSLFTVQWTTQITTWKHTWHFSFVQAIWTLVKFQILLTLFVSPSYWVSILERW